jgi:RNA processing factor Prp31
MNWNPYKRIAGLEALHAKNIAVLAALATRIDLLGRTDDAQARWLSALETRLQDLSNPVAISRADVEKEAKARLQRAAYARKYYAKKKKTAKAAAPGAEGAK